MGKKTALITLIMVISLALGFQTVNAKEQLRIGCLFPFTGDLARLGIESYRGAEVARIVQNEKGGLWGKEIVFVKADAVDPKIAMTEAERLITKEGVNLILGTYSSSLSFVASEVAEKYGKIYWELGAVSDKITERGFTHLFRVAPKSSYYTVAASKLVRDYVLPKIGKTPQNVRIAGIHEDSLFGQTSAENIGREIKKVGLYFVLTDFYSRKAVDLSPLIMRLKQANPDILMATQYLTDVTLFRRQCKELNFNVKAYIGLGGGISMDDFYKALGNDVNGLVDMSFCPPPDAVNPKYALGVVEFLKKHDAVFGSGVTTVYPSANYTGAMALWDVLKKAGSMDPNAIRKAALEIDIPDNTTTSGWGIKFDSTGQNIRAKIIAEQWQEGKLWTAWPVQAAPPGRELKFPLPTWEERKKKG